MSKIVQSFYLICQFVALAADESGDDDDIFPPIGRVGEPHRSHRHIRDCQPAKYNNVTSESFPSHNSTSSKRSSVPIDVKYFSKNFDFMDRRFVAGHQVIVNDPAQTITILEPLRIGGCAEKVRETVAATAHQKQCLFAVNGGLFNVTDGACLGNVVSDGREAFNSGGIQNVHFGIKRDGSLFFGYIPDGVVLNETFDQLVGGVVWLVRNGENFVETSKAAECPDSQSTGTLQRFIDIISARTAIGHDKEGRVHIVQVEGKSYERGLNLNEFADFLLSLGIVNAINLDGGGSATAVLNGSLINYPSDTRTMDGMVYNVARNVSTIICVTDCRCVPGCGHHGSCLAGRCVCDANWSGAKCQQLLCPGANCSGNGDCSPDGCKCNPGYHGDNCSTICPKGSYGYDCRATCRCPGNDTACHPITGQCHCDPGFTGLSCESSCDLGRFGEECRGVCHCKDGCFCHPIDGSCALQTSSHNHWKEGQCFGDLMIANRRMDLVSPKEMTSWFSAVVILSVITSLSLIVNLYFLYRCCETGSLRRRPRPRPVRQFQHLPKFVSDDDENLSDEKIDDDMRANIPLMNLDANDSPRRSVR